MRGTSYVKKMGAALAIAAASMLASGCTSMCGESNEHMVKCAGLNTCKGSSCDSNHENSCKGKKARHNAKNGWSYMSESDCKARSGHVVD